MITDLNLQGGVFLSKSRDSAKNLAMEESLLSRVQAGDYILFLYENNPSVVIGRFQNPWRECRTGLVRRRRIPLLRRVSGGGTVVHGPGNLNFSVITGNPVPDKKGNLLRIVKALSTLGIQAGLNDRYDLVIQNSKVSGSAFRQASGCSMHHGTLLVNADLDNLRMFLHTNHRDMEIRGVSSNPSPVVNLSEVISGISVSDAVEALAAKWGSPEGPVRISPSDFEDDSVFRTSLQRLGSDEWTWGKTPKFSERISGLEGFEKLVFEIDIREGRIFTVLCSGDGRLSLTPDTGFLIGCPYHGPDIISAGPPDTEEWLKELAAAVDGDGPDTGV